MIFLEEIIKKYIYWVYIGSYKKLSYVHDFNCNWLDSSTDFDKRHEATDAVAEIEDEL